MLGIQINITIITLQNKFNTNYYLKNVFKQIIKFIKMKNPSDLT